MNSVSPVPIIEGVLRYDLGRMGHSIILMPSNLFHSVLLSTYL